MGKALPVYMCTGNLTGHYQVQPKLNYRLEDLYGGNEMQEAEGGEADLHRHLSGCRKNPGHKNFIPVNKFTIKNLPEGHQNKDLYELVKTVADLTVRVDVKQTSPHRLQFWPGTSVMYPYFNIRGKEVLRTASGKIIDVYVFMDDFSDCGSNRARKYTPCPCDKCSLSAEPNNIWWEIQVQTATHVVFDDSEASHTSLRLFYDTQDSPLVKLDSVSICVTDIERDQCFLTCVTCDTHIGNKMYKTKNNLEILWKKVYENYKKCRDESKLTFIVSHPHGCHKQVSIGHWVDRFLVNQFVYRFTYTTCTCPGSSGAYVNILGYNTFSCQPVHSGSLNKGLNYSGAGVVIS